MILDIVGEYWDVKWINYTYNDSATRCNYTAPIPKLTKIKAVWLSDEGHPATNLETNVFEGDNSTSGM